MTNAAIKGVDELLKMQEQLMKEVPHSIRVDVYPKMTAAMALIEAIMLYLNSCGHKPWRPEPLDDAVRDGRFFDIERAVVNLRMHHKEHTSGAMMEARKLVSALGIIEETVEYLGAHKNRLEEITDVLFFYLESVILGGYSWAEISEEYVRKHKVNLERYKKAKEGDYTWDKRREGGL